MLILPIIGVDQGRWITVMGIISILALPAVFLEYYFTRERVTEESMSAAAAEVKTVSLTDQIKGCFKSQYWIVIIGIIIVYNLYNNFQVTSSLYYANWVLGTYNDGTTYTIMNAVGQAPLGLGVFLLWPLVRKIGKSSCMIVGSALAIVGNVMCAIFPTNMGIVLGGLALRSFGALPITYILMSMLADALDHVEWLNGFRCDGFSSSVYSIILTVTVGISTGIFNAFLSMVNYVPPLADGSYVAQAANVQNYFVIGYFIVPAVGAFLVGFLCAFYRADKEMPKIQSEIVERHRAEALARGEEYVSPEELAAREQAEQEKIAEEKRVEELKAKCARKGLSFDEEEAKYQAKLAADRAKREKKRKKQ
uniref:Na+/melibiose symporter and related transporters n=1 Tax=uncultured bacterium scaffold00056 TaxID=1132475 RepID=I7AVH3_9BACT|nr:Na+/melibiose symporter and related transporters [uncultured bacterium scaffold00056]